METPVSASISTPVWPVTFAVQTGDQGGRLLDAHDAGHPGNAENVAFFGGALQKGLHRGGREADRTLGGGRADGFRLGGDIHHDGVAGGVKMR